MSTAVPGSRGGAGQQGLQGIQGIPGPPGPGLKSFRASGVSDAAGNVVFNMAAASFAAAPVVTAAIQAAVGNQPIDYRVTALTATSCTVNVRQSPVLVVLSLSVLGVAAPLAGAIVHLHAIEAGVQA